MSFKEKRKYNRLPFVKPIRYSSTGSNIGEFETIHNCVSVDISRGGLGMITDYPLEAGNILIFEDEIEINNITAKASVVRWARKTEKKRYRVGLEFVR